MINKLVFYGAYIVNIVMLIALIALLLEAYGEDQLYILLMFIPPILSLFALHKGPDLEERKLTKLLNKARMRDELQKLGIEEE